MRFADTGLVERRHAISSLNSFVDTVSLEGDRGTSQSSATIQHSYGRLKGHTRHWDTVGPVAVTRGRTATRDAALSTEKCIVWIFKNKKTS